MNYTTTIPSELISREELEALIETFRKHTGKEIELHVCFVIMTDDINFTTMVDALKDALAAPAKVKANGHKTKEGKKKEEKEAGMTSHTRRNVESGTIISMQALRKMIRLPNDGQLENTVWEDIKGQRYVVSGGELIKEPQS